MRAIERLELGYERLREANERIICVQLPGFGAGGRAYRDYLAYGLLVEPIIGLAAVMGRSNEEPRICAALLADGGYERRRLWPRRWSGASALGTGRARRPLGARVTDRAARGACDRATADGSGAGAHRQRPTPGRAVDYRSLRGEGEWIALAVRNEGEWFGLCSVAVDRAMGGGRPGSSSSSCSAN